jgi:iron complex transport system substrate-binding protein
MPFPIVTFPKRNSATAFTLTFLLSICLEALSSPLETELSRVPQRIVSLGPSLTEELYLLGVEDSIVGVTVYCNRPEEAQKKEKVGTAIKVDVEKIISLRPDMVLATTLSDRDQIEKIGSLGVNVVTFTPCRDFQEICKQFLKLGKIVGEEEKARDIVGQVRDRVASVNNKVRYLTKPKVFVQIGAKPLYTVTEDSFIQDIISLAGGMNIAHDAKTGLFSREEVISRNPDVVIIVTMGIVGEEEKRIWERFKALKAVQNKRVYIIDSHKICSPTPLAFVESLEEITSFLHPVK